EHQWRPAVETNKPSATPKSRMPLIVGVVAVLVIGMVVISRFTSHNPGSTADDASNAAKVQQWSKSVQDPVKDADEAPKPDDQQAQDDAMQTMTGASDG